jgi:ABC-2 type transport system permease protein
MPGHLATLVRKEFLAVWRDRRSRMILIGPPLLMMLLFSFAATLDVTNVSIAILNRDAGKWGAELTHRIAAAPTFSRVIELRSEAQVREAIELRRALVALQIGPDFSRAIEAGGSGMALLVVDGRRANAGQIVAGYLAAIAEDLGGEIRSARGAVDPGPLVVRNWFNPNLIYRWFTVPGLVAILTMIIGIIVTALSVARERELGTFDQLLVSPLRPFTILLGKTIPALAFGMAEGTVLLLFAIWVFRIPFNGSYVLLYAAMLLFLLATVGVGLFISSLCQTQQQAILGAFVFLAPSVLLSGFATPVSNMPEWLQILTMANPLRHFFTIAVGIFIKGMPAAAVAAHALPLAVIAIVTLGAANWLFRRRLG